MFASRVGFGGAWSIGQKCISVRHSQFAQGHSSIAINVNGACRPAIPGVYRVIQTRNGAVASPKEEAVEGISKSTPYGTEIGTRLRVFALMLPFRHIWEIHSHRFMPRPVTYNTLLKYISLHISLLFDDKGWRILVSGTVSCAAVLLV